MKADRILERANRDSIATLKRLLGYDPWSLTQRERRELRTAMRDAQDRWLPRLRNLIEPPPLRNDFPAFLLETEPFRTLRDDIGDATERTALDTATADTLQRFTDRYRGYLAESA